MSEREGEREKRTKSLFAKEDLQAMTEDQCAPIGDNPDPTGCMVQRLTQPGQIERCITRQDFFSFLVLLQVHVLLLIGNSTR
jgi:hypothetical protein